MSKKALLSTATAVLVVFGSMAAIASAADETAAPGGSDTSSSVSTPVESTPVESTPAESTPAESTPAGDDTSKGEDDNKPSTPDAKPIEVKPIEIAEEVKPGEKQDVTTEAGVVTINVAADDEALVGATVNISNSTDEKVVAAALEDAVAATAGEEAKAQVKKAADAVATGDAFMLDISFTKGNDTVQPGKPVSITVPAPAELADLKTIFVYHVGANGLEAIDASIDDGKITLTSDKFSPFIVSGVDLLADDPATSEPDDTSKGEESNAPGGSDENSNGGDGNNGGNGDQANTGIALAVAPVVLAAGAVVAFAVKKRK